MTDRSQGLEMLRSLKGVVVGDDGSGFAAAALEEAARECERRGAALHVVRAWSLASAVRPENLPFGIVPSMAELEAATIDDEQRRLHELLGDAVGAELHVVHAPATTALLAASEDAELLVVGHRGLGGFDRLMLGSVAEQCVRYAACSVLVVRAR